MSNDPNPLPPPEVNIRVATTPSLAGGARGLGVAGSPAGHSSPEEIRIAHEEYMKLVQTIFLGPGSEGTRAVVFAGIDPGNGCSQVCRTTAEVLAANSSASVCLVQAGVPSMPNGMNGESEISTAGSANREAGRTGTSGCTYVHQMQKENLWALSPNDVAATASKPIYLNSLRTRLPELRQEFNWILIDAPPLNLYGDAIGIAQLADGLVLVIEADATRRETARKVTENLRRAKVHILGAVLNKRTFPIPERLYRKL